MTHSSNTESHRTQSSDNSKSQLKLCGQKAKYKTKLIKKESKPHDSKSCQKKQIRSLTRYHRLKRKITGNKVQIHSISEDLSSSDYLIYLS